MTPEQIEAGLCELMRQHDLIFVRCWVHKFGGIEWQVKRRDDCIRTRRNFNELAAAWSVDVTAQAELMEYRLRAGA